MESYQEHLTVLKRFESSLAPNPLQSNRCQPVHKLV